MINKLNQCFTWVERWGWGGLREKKQEMGREVKDKEMGRLKFDLRSALWTFLRVWRLGLMRSTVSVREWGLTEKTDGEKAQRGPLGGCSGITDSPSIKLIIENGQIILLWMQLRNGEDNLLIQFQCQKRTQGGLGQKIYYVEKEQDYCL